MAPGTDWRVRVNYFETIAALQVKTKASDECRGMCHQHSYDNAETTGIIAELFLAKGHTTTAIIAHEAAHAAVAFWQFAKLDLTSETGDEFFAEIVENVIKETIAGIARIKNAKARTPSSAST